MKYISPEYMLNRVAGATDKPKVQEKQDTAQVKSFDEVYRQIAGKGMNVSKHAASRIASRNVNLSDEEIEKMSDAFDKAKKKGIKDAVIMINGNILIANVENKTIITMAKSTDLNENIITNIDGAIFL